MLKMRKSSNSLKISYFIVVRIFNIDMFPFNKCFKCTIQY